MKAILVIDIADDIAEAYEDFTVDYDLRGTPKDDQKVNESIKYVEDCSLRPLPERKEVEKDEDERVELIGIGYALGWNTCLEEIEK